MGFYDIIDDIAQKQVIKTETGDNRIFGVVIGIVTDNYDESMQGRVCVNIPGRDQDANNLKWARVAMPSSGKKWGHYFLPEVGDQVLVAFEQGNIEKPYIIGCIPRSNDSFMTRASDKDNQYKKIVTKNGNTIEFKDANDGDGEKDVISIYTPGKKHKFIMDNEKKEILISDEKGENEIDFKTENGKMVIKANQNLEIDVGDNIKITMNGSNGTVTVDCSKVNVKTSGDTVVNASGNAKVSGTNISLEAGTALKLNSSGAAKITGTPIQIG